METLSHPSAQQASSLRVMERFFNRYDPPEAQRLLWRWFILSVKKGVTVAPEAELKQFAEFFDMLQELIVAASNLHKKGGEHA